MRDMSAPLSESAPNPYAIYRVPPGRRIKALILSDTWVGVLSHYANKQSIICQGTGCELCANQRVNPRWRGYIVARLHLPETPTVTLEFTERCFGAFRDRLDRYESLMGHTVLVQRTKKSSTSPLHASFDDAVIPRQSLTCSADLVANVARAYRVNRDVIEFGLPQVAQEKSGLQALKEARAALKLKKA